MGLIEPEKEVYQRPAYVPGEASTVLEGYRRLGISRLKGEMKNPKEKLPFGGERTDK